MAFFSDITHDKYTQIMEYLKEGTPLCNLLLKSNNQMHSCHLAISVIRFKSGLENIANPFDYTLCTDTEINEVSLLLEQYDESDYDNIVNISLTIWYLAKVKQYKKGIYILSFFTTNTEEMEIQAFERISSKLSIFSEMSSIMR